MSSKSAKENGGLLTAANMRFLAICFKHIRGIPEIDFEGVAREHPFKSAGVARTRFGQIRRIIREALPDESNPTQNKGPPPTPKKRKADPNGDISTPKKRVQMPVKDEDITADEGNNLEDPMKGEKTEFVKQEDEDEDDEDGQAFAANGFGFAI